MSLAAAENVICLTENQARWVVTGICLNKVLNPVLRTFLEPHMQMQYNAYKTSNNIHNQLHPTHLQKDGSKTLNYEPINNNYQLHKRNVRLYDYRVASHVDFAKLYLQTHMAKFSGFDESCDPSATLGLLCEVPSLNPVIPGNARDVRTDVRNEWGHCNFAVWDEPKFLVCFQKMEALVRSLGLSKEHTDELVGIMNDWISKGKQFCMDSCSDKDFAQTLHQELALVLRMEGGLKKQLEMLRAQLGSQLNGFNERLLAVEFEQNNSKAVVDCLIQDVCQLKMETSDRFKGRIEFSQEQVFKASKQKEDSKEADPDSTQERQCDMWCNTCKVSLNSKSQAASHWTSPKHVKKCSAPISTTFRKDHPSFCAVCEVTLNSESQANQHFGSTKHNKKIAKGVSQECQLKESHTFDLSP